MIEHVKDLITIGGGIGALIAVWKAVKALVHFSDDINDIKRHTFENYLSSLRLTIMSNDMPLGERIIAADDYLKAGGNGEVKKYIETHLHTKELVKDYEESED